MIIDYIHLALFLRYAKDVGPAATCDVQVRQWEMKYSDSALPGGPFLSTLGNETWLWIFSPFINDFAVETSICRDFYLTLPANGTNTKRLIIWARFLQAYVHHARAISLKHASCLFFAVFDMLVGASENCTAVHSKTNFRLVAKMRTISLDWLGSSTCRTRTLAEHKADASLMLLVSRSHGMNLR